MPRANISSGLITNQDQGGGSKKQGQPPTTGLGTFAKNIIQRRTGTCCPEKPSIYINISDVADKNTTNNIWTLKNNKTTIPLGEILNIPAQNTLRIGAGNVVIVDGTMNVNIGSQLIIQAGGTLRNNNNTVNVFRGVMDIEAGGEVVNSGLVTSYNATINNYGSITNNGGLIEIDEYNIDAWTNSFGLDQNSTLNNEGTITNNNTCLFAISENSNLINKNGLVLLGCGKMGSALLKGWLADGINAKSINIIEPNPTKWLKKIGIARQNMEGIV